MTMDERKRRILHAVIKDYVDTAEPVGSRTIAKKYDFGVSPATIRNEMADLEEMGYIEQPHTSAGRVPSDKGYRYYVDQLMETVEPSPAEISLINEAFSQKLLEKDGLLRQSCSMISRLTNYTALILSSRVGGGKLAKIKLLPMPESQVMVAMITDTGVMHHRLLAVGEDIPVEQLLDMEMFLQAKLIGLTMAQINKTLLQELKLQMAKQRDILNEAIDLLEEAVTEESTEMLYSGGAANMLNQPEFQDINKVKTVLEAIEGESIIKELLAPKTNNDPGIYIGMEMPYQSINHCSIITASYRVNGEVLGTVGVLGPTRMAYPKVISLVKMVTEQLTTALSKK